jgi:hypothetical protein
MLVHELIAALQKCDPFARISVTTSVGERSRDFDLKGCTNDGDIVDLWAEESK